MISAPTFGHWMQRTLPIAFLATALTVGGIAQAQTQSAKGPAAASASTPVGEVVVKGLAPAIPASRLPDVVWNDTKVRVQPGDANLGNLPRWMKAVCPGVFGLTQGYARFVVGRITAITNDFTPAQPKCGRGVNLLVTVTSTPQAVMDDVRAHYRLLLGYHYIDEEKALATFHGPIEAWYVTATNGRIDYAYGLGPRINGGGLPGVPTGRLQNGAIDAVVFVLVVVDAKAIEDQPVGRVAAYVAALALSKTGRRKGCSPLPSILDALDPACPSSASLDTLSAYDRSLLKGLYASDPADVGQAERGSVMLSVLRDMRKQAKAEAAAKTAPDSGAKPGPDAGPSPP